MVSEHSDLLDNDQPRHHQPRMMWEKARSSYGVFLLLGLLSLVSLAMRLLNLPLNRVIESRYCKEHYLQHEPSVIRPDGSIPEDRCKINSVQEKLAWLEGIIETCVTACDLVVTIPFGSISDRLGRRLILCLNTLAAAVMFSWFLLVGRLENVFPVEAMIAGPFISLFGGGDCVLASTVFAYLTDIAIDFPTRTSYFAYVTAISYIVSFFGPTLASLIMSRNQWLPFYLGISLLLGALPIVALIPQGIASGVGGDSEIVNQANQANDQVPEEAPLLSEQTRRNPSRSAVKARTDILKNIRLEMKALYNLIVGRSNFQLLMGTVLIMGIANSSTSILVLYISKRYSWAFAKVGYLLSAKAAVNIALFTLIIPNALRAWLRRRPASEITASFFGAASSLLMSFFGAIFLAIAAKVWVAIIALVIYALGSAAPVFIMSLVKSPVVTAEENNASGRDFSIIMILKTVGALIGTPLITAAWVRGVEVSGAGLGLPYYITAILDLAALVAIWRLHLRWRKEKV